MFKTFVSLLPGHASYIASSKLCALTRDQQGAKFCVRDTTVELFSGDPNALC